MKPKKVIIDLTKETLNILQSSGQMLLHEDGTYYNLPQWFKTTENPYRMQVLFEDELPESISHFIDSVNIKKALEQLVYLRKCEQEEAGPQPMTTDWLDAFNDAITALQYENHAI